MCKCTTELIIKLLNFCLKQKDYETCVVPFRFHPAPPCVHLPGWILKGETKPEINSACDPLCCHLPPGKHEDMKDNPFLKVLFL